MHIEERALDSQRFNAPILNKEENLSKMPKNLPVYFIAGEEDPVGDYGEGVKKAYHDFENAGMENLSIQTQTFT